MLPNVGTDIIPPDSLWIGSEKMAWNDIPVADGFSFPVWIFLCAGLTVIFIIACKFPSQVPGFISSFPRPLAGSRPLSFPIALSFIMAAVSTSILISGFLCHLSILPVSCFRLCAAVILAALTAKTVILALITNVTGHHCFLSFIRTSLILLTAVCFITLAISVTTWILPFTAGTNVTLYTLIILISLTILIYLHKITITLFSAGISPFYSFLYLCTLEILPVFLSVSLISRL